MSRYRFAAKELQRYLLLKYVQAFMYTGVKLGLLR